MIHGTKVGIVTRFKDRLNYISQALPTWIALSEIDQIVIVDWDSEEDIIPFVNSINDERISVIRVPNQKYWDPGRAHNVGIRFVQTDLIFIVDCDVKINTPCFEKINPLPNNEFYIRSDKWRGDPHRLRGLSGTCMFQKKMWIEINGYAENKTSYGLEDLDFYNEAVKCGYHQIKAFTADQLTHISHGYDIRQQHYKDKYDDLKDAIKVAENQLRCMEDVRYMEMVKASIYNNNCWKDMQ